MGLGTAFISERYNIKEAVDPVRRRRGACPPRSRSPPAATNHNTRHPMVTASYATTMHRLTGGRFTLGLGRGIAPLQDLYGIPRITTAQMEDFAGLMRRLWQGEVDLRPRRPGRAATRCCTSAPSSTTTSRCCSPPSGPSRSPSAAGPSTTSSSTRSSPTRRWPAASRTVKEAAEQAGRDPDSVDRLVVPGHRRRPPARGPPPAQDRRAAWPPTSRATATCSWRPTAGTRPRSSASGPTRSSAPSPARSTRRPPPSSSSTSPR